MQSFKLMYSYGNFVLMCIKVMMSFVSAANRNSNSIYFILFASVTSKPHGFAHGFKRNDNKIEMKRIKTNTKEKNVVT